MRNLIWNHAVPTLALATSLTLGCTDSPSEGGEDEVGESVGESADESTDSSGESSDEDSSSGSSSDSSTDAETDSSTDAETDTTTTGEPPPPPSACDETELPPRDGAEILVSPGGPGMVEVDGNSTTLRSVVSAANEGDTILLEDGVYTFQEAGDGQYTGVYVTTPNITLRSVSGDPSAVVLDAAYLSLGGQSGLITIDAPGVVVADIGVRRSIFHLIHLWANADDAIIHNVELIDGGQQFMKASAGEGEIDGVQVSCSLFSMTDDGRDNVWGYGSQNGNTTCYTGGIDTHDSTNWTVRDSVFEGIYCNQRGVQRPAHGKHPEFRGNMTYTGGLSEHAVHMWDSVSGTGHLVTRNHIINCARGVGLGFVNEVYGSTITNNMVFSSFPGGGGHDVGISVERAVDTLVAHNSVYFSDPEAYGSGIEYRWAETSNLVMHGNLTNRMIRARDGAVAELSDNISDDAPASWFVDAAGGDLHLEDCAGPGAAGLLGAVELDFDAETRSEPTVPGADHCGE